MPHKSFQKYSVLLILLVLFVLSAFIIYSFITAVFLAAVIAYLFHPVYDRIMKKVKSKNASALLTMLIMVVIVLLPSILIFNSLVGQAQTAYVAMGNIFSDDISLECTDQSAVLCRISLFFQVEDLGGIITSNIENAMNSMIQYSSRLFFTIPKKILDFLLMIFLLFFFIRDGREIVTSLSDITPLAVNHKANIVLQFQEITRAVIFGTVIVAIFQGLLAALGFYLFGISAPLFWGLITTIAAFLPLIGTALVWGPASIYLISIGIVDDVPGALVNGIGLLVYGALIIGLADNILKPIIISRKAKIHPTLTLLGAFGGLFAFGFIGIFAGPLILVFFITFLRIAKAED